MNPENTERMVQFVKTLGNEHRIRLAALLLEGEYTTEALAARTGQRLAAVIEHLAALRELHFVTTGNGHKTYTFDTKALYAFNRDLLHRVNKVTVLDDLSEEDRKTLLPFFAGDRLVLLPESPRKWQVLIRWLATRFETDTRYTEKQVNAIITQYHEDYATLRRAMVNMGLMQRLTQRLTQHEKTIYWRV